MLKLLKITMALATAFMLTESLQASGYESAFGFKNITEFGYASWTNSDALLQNMVTVSHVSCYRFNSLFSFGAGIGYENNFSAYRYFNQTEKVLNLMQLPFFADLRISLDRGPVIPFIFINPGYHLVLNGEEDLGEIYELKAAESVRKYVEYQGGLYFNAGMGLELRSDSTRDYSISLGYKFEQQNRTERTVYDNSIESAKRKLDLSFYTLKLGFSL